MVLAIFWDGYFRKSAGGYFATRSFREEDHTESIFAMLISKGPCELQRRH